MPQRETRQMTVNMLVMKGGYFEPLKYITVFELLYTFIVSYAIACAFLRSFDAFIVKLQRQSS